ncbi:MAG: AMP-binding protein, partial [Coriobacteriales bacterium]|nr:AMP-binding protein [Coriobacteriales bacterium]
ICSIGQAGEVCIDLSTNPPGIIREYLGDDAGTTNAKRDGWCHTGDTAWKDEDGYFWYVGRNDDVIKSSGYRIGPTEIESVLLMHDAVCECAVTAVPDELRGSAVKATIVLTDAFSPSDSLTKELQMWVKNKTAPYKFPRIIDYVDSLPKTTNGKIMRKVIFDRDNK